MGAVSLAALCLPGCPLHHLRASLPSVRKEDSQPHSSEARGLQQRLGLVSSTSSPHLPETPFAHLLHHHPGLSNKAALASRVFVSESQV